jgi:hypothetical protein
MRLRRHRKSPVQPCLVSRVPITAVLSHDLARAAATAAGRRVTLDDLEAADRIAALLVDRWAPRQS